MKMAMNAMRELPQPKPRFPYLDRQVSDYMYTVTLADRSRQEQKAASGRRLVAAGTYKEGAARGKAKATTLLRTIMAAMALAAYFWYVSMM